MSEKAVLKPSASLNPFRLIFGRKQLANIRQKLVNVMIIFLASTWAISASGQQFSIENAHTELTGEVYKLNASLKYSFSKEVLHALENGVSLYLVLDIAVIKPRRYMWDEDIAALEQRYELQYLALTDQYLLANKNSGAQHVYHTLDEALSTLEHIDGLPIIDAHLLNKNEHYMVQVRSRLDLDSLPVPLRLKAYFSGEWWLTSGWYSWDL